MMTMTEYILIGESAIILLANLWVISYLLLNTKKHGRMVRLIILTILGISTIWQILRILKHITLSSDPLFGWLQAFDSMILIFLMLLLIEFHVMIVDSFVILIPWLDNNKIKIAKYAPVFLWIICYVPFIHFHYILNQADEPQWHYLLFTIITLMWGSLGTFYETMFAILMIKMLKVLALMHAKPSDEFSKPQVTRSQIAYIRYVKLWIPILLAVDWISVALYLMSRVIPSFGLLLQDLSTNTIGIHIILIILMNGVIRKIQIPSDPSAFSQFETGTSDTKQSTLPTGAANTINAIEVK